MRFNNLKWVQFFFQLYRKNLRFRRFQKKSETKLPWFQENCNTPLEHTPSNTWKTSCCKFRSTLPLKPATVALKMVHCIFQVDVIHYLSTVNQGFSRPQSLYFKLFSLVPATVSCKVLHVFARLGDTLHLWLVPLSKFVQPRIRSWNHLCLKFPCL